MDIKDINYLEIQPSQFYISREKLEKIKTWFNPNDLTNFKKIPIKKLHGRIIFVDRHTRAYLAFMHGLKEIPLYWETEELSWDLYQHCVNACNEYDIYSIKDLEGRILSPVDYKLLWDDYCDNLHNSVKKHRN